MTLTNMCCSVQVLFVNERKPNLNSQWDHDETSHFIAISCPFNSHLLTTAYEFIIFMTTFGWTFSTIELYPLGYARDVVQKERAIDGQE